MKTFLKQIAISRNNIKILVFILLVGQTSLAQDYSAKFNKVNELGGIEEYLYKPNGMDVLLLQDNSAAVVTVQIVYRVGSKNEVSGNTGSTHLLEHLNFKGTPTFNKRNGNAIFTVLQGIGAQMNATTWNDRTNYFETIPSDKIELALHIESDRMRNSLLLKEDKDAEMTVVRNEFERGENNPNSILSKEIWATAYMAHPYHHNTIGWRSDIENMPIEVLRNFYNTYYWPNNATLTIIGDFQKDNLFALVDKYFGKITKAPHDLPQPYTEEPPQYGPRKIVIKKQGQQGVIMIGYKIPGRMHEDLPALTVLGEYIGSGTSSVLNKTFVDTRKAFYGYAGPSNYKEVGLFTVGLGFGPNANYDALNAELLKTIDSVKSNGVMQEDVDRIVAKLNTQTILSRDGSGNIASQITEAIAGGDWTDYIRETERLSKVTAEDVKRVANTYLVENQSTTGYFIPEQAGGNGEAQTSASNFVTGEGSKYYYRNPEAKETIDETATYVATKSIEDITSAYETVQSSASGEKYIRKEVAGIDVVSVKTGAKGFITVAASIPMGSYLSSGKNEAIPNLTVAMLSKGTQLHDKFQFSQKLEKLGVSFGINVRDQNIEISFKCLKKDLNDVMDLLTEELRYPLFDVNELETLKQQATGNLKQGLSNPGTMGRIALSQAIYPIGHPNYKSNIETSLENLKSATIDEIKTFYKTYFGTAGMHVVAVGDVDTKDLYGALTKNFKGWNGGLTNKATFKEPTKGRSQTKIITIPQKPSAELFIGEYTGIQHNDKDYIPFYIGTSVLGGGFSGRLMKTVRDRDGLTYGINAQHSGHDDVGGFWSVNATFNPSLFQKGLDATMVEVKKWVKEGITADELTFIKDNIAGSFKVGMATTSGLAQTLLSFLERGLSPDYLDQFPKDVQAVTLKEVNQTIKKYIDLDKLIIVKSGSLDQNGNPLK